MSGNYEVQGSEECARIKELAIMRSTAGPDQCHRPETGVSYDREADSVATVWPVTRIR
jgi:hypothetical protein